MNSEEMMKRTTIFAHNCVKLALSLPKNTLGQHVSKQLIRSSTSVAANYRSVCLSQSKASFIAKISIVLEEADESAFWMEFIQEEKLLSDSSISSLIKEASELTAIFCSSRITAKTNYR